MVIEMLLFFLIKNGIRGATNWIKDNKVYCVYYLLAFGLLAYCISAIGSYILVSYEKYLLTAVCVYEIVKIIQKSQILNVPVQMIQYKVLNQWQYKFYILIKSVGASVILMAISTLISYFTAINCLNQGLWMICSLNVAVNLMSVLKNQVRYAKGVIAITVIGILTTVYFHSLIIAVSLALLSFIIFVFQKAIILEVLFCFYQFMWQMGIGILNKDTDKMVEAQKSISSPPKDLAIGFLERHYEGDFGRCKELKRVINHHSMAINTFILSSCFTFFGLYLKEEWVYGVVMVISMVILGNLLSLLNREEARLAALGMYLPFHIREWFRQKYLIQLGVTVLLLAPTWLLVPYLGFIPYVICILITPFKSILHYFHPRKLFNKVIYYMLEFVVFSLCFLTYTLGLF